MYIPNRVCFIIIFLFVFVEFSTQKYQLIKLSECYEDYFMRTSKDTSAEYTRLTLEEFYACSNNYDFFRLPKSYVSKKDCMKKDQKLINLFCYNKYQTMEIFKYNRDVMIFLKQLKLLKECTKNCHAVLKKCVPLGEKIDHTTVNECLENEVTKVQYPPLLKCIRNFETYLLRGFIITNISNPPKDSTTTSMCDGMKSLVSCGSKSRMINISDTWIKSNTLGAIAAFLYQTTASLVQNGDTEFQRYTNIKIPKLTKTDINSCKKNMKIENMEPICSDYQVFPFHGQTQTFEQYSNTILFNRLSFLTEEDFNKNNKSAKTYPEYVKEFEQKTINLHFPKCPKAFDQFKTDDVYRNETYLQYLERFKFKSRFVPLIQELWQKEKALEKTNSIEPGEFSQLVEASKKIQKNSSEKNRISPPITRKPEERANSVLPTYMALEAESDFLNAVFS